MSLPIQRQARLFRNGRNQALRIPREFEFSGDEVTIRRDGVRLIIEPIERKPNRLAEWLAKQEPIDDFPEIDELPIEPEDFF
jgi:antitoxin VapB